MPKFLSDTPAGCFVLHRRKPRSRWWWSPPRTPGLPSFRIRPDRPGSSTIGRISVYGILCAHSVIINVARMQRSPSPVSRSRKAEGPRGPSRGPSVLPGRPAGFLEGVRINRLQPLSDAAMPGAGAAAVLAETVGAVLAFRGCSGRRGRGLNRAFHTHAVHVLVSARWARGTVRRTGRFRCRGDSGGLFRRGGRGLRCGGRGLRCAGRCGRNCRLGRGLCDARGRTAWYR